MSTAFSIFIAPCAQKQIRNLAPSVLPHVIACLELLQSDPHPTGVEKLNQNPNFWRTKAGDSHRVIYTILSERQTMVVVLVGTDRVWTISELVKAASSGQVQDRVERAKNQSRVIQGGKV